jgi:type IV pilus assembly protein PilQ
MTLRYSIKIAQCFALQLILISTAWANQGTGSASYHVAGIDFKQSDAGFFVNVQGKTPPTYTIYELFEPLRVVLDIADAGFAEGVTLPMTVNKGPVSRITGKILAEKEPSIAKVEIFLNEDRPYSVERQGNDIQIKFEKNKSAEKQNSVSSEVVAPVVSGEPDKVKTDNTDMAQEIGETPSSTLNNDHDKKDLVADLLESISEPVTDKLDKQLQRAGVEHDKFAAAGYKKQKISVDFYKIDLHNVFRLFGEISGSNMIIDQGVGGTLTLALDEVPWDFAMDIILNLKGLQKEERYNTIVISQNNKTFFWPEEAEKALDIKAPTSDVKIAIEQRLDMPAGMMESRKLVHQAQRYEQTGNNKKALELYEAALLKWPENSELARRIASFCLVKMGMNAKAQHYAEAALKLNSKDYRAALQAAISAANMRKPQAEEYFKLAISEERPAQEALISYASYAEQGGDFATALNSLAKYTEIYGDSLDSMIARARVLDRDGQKSKAATVYQSILYSGFELTADLSRYIKGRVSLEQ